MSKKITLADLTLREKIGQTALSWPRNDLTRPDLTPYGGIWSTGSIPFKVVNMDDIKTESTVTAQSTREEIKTFNSKMKVPILPAMDSTSGINRAFGELNLITDQVALGAANSEELAYEAGVVRAKQLKAVGSGWLWWPEIDLVNRNSAINWGRLYSDNPDVVSKLAIASVKGCQDEGVAATVKHFPGSDEIEYRDPHGTVSLLNISKEAWNKRQGKIFKNLIDAGVYSIMVAHNAFPAVDDTIINGNYIPSTVSYKVVTELLKNELGFKGVVITDAVNMKGLLDIYDCNEAEIYIAAINAGNDVLLGVKENYIDVIEKAVNDGRISIERIDDACQRVLDMKEKLGMFKEGFTTFDNSVEEANKAVKEHNKKVAENAISLVVNRRGILPFKKEIKKVSIVYLSYDEAHMESLETMKKEFNKRGAEVYMQRNLLSPVIAKEMADTSDLIIYVSYLMRGPYNYFSGDEKKSFHFMLTQGIEKSIVVNMGMPFVYFDHFTSFHTFINCYNYYEETQKAVVASIYGEIPFKGGEPFKLIPDEFVYLKR